MSAGHPATLEQLVVDGREHRRVGALDAAVAVFTTAHHTYPQEPRPLVERGAVLILQAAYDEARSDYAAAAELDPRYPGLDSYVAELDLYTGRAESALTLSTAAAVVEPDNLMHPVNAAHAHLLLGHLELALQGYRALRERVHPGKRQTGGVIAAHDLDLLEEAGVEVPGVAQARAVLRG